MFFTSGIYSVQQTINAFFSADNNVFIHFIKVSGMLLPWLILFRCLRDIDTEEEEGAPALEKSLARLDGSMCAADACDTAFDWEAWEEFGDGSAFMGATTVFGDGASFFFALLTEG